MSLRHYLNKKRVLFLFLSLGVVICCTIILLFKKHQLEAAFNRQIEQSDDQRNINYYKHRYSTLLGHHTIICLVHGLTCLLDIVPTYFLLKFALTIEFILVLLIDCFLLPSYQSGFAFRYLRPYLKLQDYFAISQHLFICQFFFAVLMMLLMLHSRTLYYQLVEQWMAGKDGIVFKNRYSRSLTSYNWKYKEEEEEEEEEEETSSSEKEIKKKIESESKKTEPEMRKPKQESKKTEPEDKKTEPENKKTDEAVVKEVITKPEQKEIKSTMKAIAEEAAAKVGT